MRKLHLLTRFHNPNKLKKLKPNHASEEFTPSSKYDWCQNLNSEWSERGESDGMLIMLINCTEVLKRPWKKGREELGLEANWREEGGVVAETPLSVLNGLYEWY